jgi:hypothetical protein
MSAFEVRDEVQQISFAGVRGKPVFERAHANLDAHPCLGADVHRTCRIIPDQHDGKAAIAFPSITLAAMSQSLKCLNP